MRSGGSRFATATTVALGVLLVGSTSTPAHAETVRSQQWYLDTMQVAGMWKTSTGKGVTVAIIDSGVEATLPDLRGQILAGKDFTRQPGGAHVDFSNHGTGIAAMIAATGQRADGNGSFGLAPGAKILPLRASSGDATNAEDGSKEFSRTMSAAIRYAADSEAKVINISMANSAPSDQMTKAVEYASTKGKLIFAGVGNEGEKGNPVMYPAATPGVVGVAAVDREIRATKWSESGPQVDLAAPGDEMVHACAGGTEICKTNGTSDATALASASAALIWSVHPNWTANQVTRVLINTAGGPQSGEKRSDLLGYGVVRPRIALKNPGNPGPANVNPLPGPTAPPATPSPKPTHSKATGGMPSTAASDKSDNNTPLWIGLGLGATALLGAGIATPLVLARRRRRDAEGRVPPHPPLPPGPHQPQQPPIPTGTFGPPEPSGYPATPPSQHPSSRHQ
ncbi:type VII secretion-associated serine protease mycosin [Streptomyces sp. H27-D2]|uniref:type VII secretion-associated serine protease mycosin n=1 Tax=Streptomyces sp. H27-D2 TaxID=3046304 RepID=UPI002DBF452E|nr:type VII secretion-associated serine protease mycosin [Streptomyces sp. H27-D2]MEC4017139.1 type VII secretion-associated serine protease mycosin [Streptomyces sp. H27-D2]